MIVEAVCLNRFPYVENEHRLRAKIIQEIIRRALIIVAGFQPATIRIFQNGKILHRKRAEADKKRIFSYLYKRNVGNHLGADHFVEFLYKIAALHHQRGAGGRRRHADGEHLIADADGFCVSAERLARYRRPSHEGAVFVERSFETGKAQIAQKHAAYFFRLSSFHTFCSALM